jgi:hypothetical protein
MSKIIAGTFIALLICSCSPVPPKKEDIKLVVVKFINEHPYYGPGGKREVNDVSIISIRRADGEKGVFRVLTGVSVNYYPAADDSTFSVSQEVFLDTMMLSVRKGPFGWTSVSYDK